MEAEAGLWVTKEDEAAAAVWCRSQEERYFLLLPATSCSGSDVERFLFGF